MAYSYNPLTKHTLGVGFSREVRDAGTIQAQLDVVTKLERIPGAKVDYRFGGSLGQICNVRFASEKALDAAIEAVLHTKGVDAVYPCLATPALAVA